MNDVTRSGQEKNPLLPHIHPSPLEESCFVHPNKKARLLSSEVLENSPPSSASICKGFDVPFAYGAAGVAFIRRIMAPFLGGVYSSEVPQTYSQGSQEPAQANAKRPLNSPNTFHVGGAFTAASVYPLRTVMHHLVEEEIGKATKEAPSLDIQVNKASFSNPLVSVAFAAEAYPIASLPVSLLGPLQSGDIEGFTRELDALLMSEEGLGEVMMVLLAQCSAIGIHADDSLPFLKAVIASSPNRQAVVNFRGKNNNTPLHFAVANQSFAQARLLLQAGADVQQLNNEGMSPLKQVFEMHTRSESRTYDPLWTLFNNFLKAAHRGERGF